MRPTILLDMDGCLADFQGGACRIHNAPDYGVKIWDWYKSDWGMDEEEFWGPILTRNFYQNHVDKLPWANELIGLAHSFGEVVISTANPFHPELIASKVQWIEDNLPFVDVMLGDRKSLMAKPGNILIDDSDKNVSSFWHSGGFAVHFPQPWNSADFATPYRLGYVRQQLSALTKVLEMNWEFKLC